MARNKFRKYGKNVSVEIKLLQSGKLQLQNIFPTNVLRMINPFSQLFLPS